MFWKNNFLIPFLIFIFLNLFVYLFIFTFHDAVPFNKDSYRYSSHHYVRDHRVDGNEFGFLRGLGVWDAQWYLMLSKVGYPAKHIVDQFYMKWGTEGLMAFAFFPVYPTILFIANRFIQNIELSAFVVSNVLLIVNFFSLYYIIGKLYSRDLAVRAIFLLFLFPFSIFYRSYFTEGIFLFLLIWFCYFLIRKKWFIATLFASVLFVTRPNGPFLSIVLFFAFCQGIRHHKLSLQRAFLYLSLSVAPFLLWCIFCFLRTGDPFYWYNVQQVWFQSHSFLQTIGQNISSIFNLFNLPLHEQHQSKIDVVVFVSALILLICSRRFYKHNTLLWWVSFVICLMPLIFKDFMSYSRFQIISFPLFIYLASTVKGIKFFALCILFLFLLLLTSLFFVNWYWIG